MRTSNYYVSNACLYPIYIRYTYLMYPYSILSLRHKRKNENAEQYFTKMTKATYNIECKLLKALKRKALSNKKLQSLTVITFLNEGLETLSLLQNKLRLVLKLWSSFFVGLVITVEGHCQFWICRFL